MKKILPILLILLSAGCNINDLDFNDLEGPTLSGNVALPIGTISYTIRDLIEEVEDSSLVIEEDSTSLLILTYIDSLEYQGGEDLVYIPDVFNTASITIPSFPATGFSRVETIDTTFKFTYPATESETLDSVFYDSGSLTFRLLSDISNDIDYSFEISQTTRISDNTSVSFTGAASENSIVSDVRLLEGHKTQLISQNDSNIFFLRAIIDIDIAANEATDGGDLEISLGFVDQDFSILYGKFGQDTIQVGDEQLDIEFFEQLGDYGLRLGSPTVAFHFESSVGLPLGLQFNSLYGINGEGGTQDTIYLSGSITDSPQVVNASASPNIIQESNIEINNQNSSLREFLSITPGTIGFGLQAIANPVDPLASNFLLDSSGIKSVVEIGIPLELSLDNLSGEVDFDLGSGLEFDEAEELKLRIVAENGSPFSVRLEIEIQNEADSIILSVPRELIMEIPTLNTQGLVTSPRKTVADILLDIDGVNALRIGKKIVLRVIVNTPKTQTREVFVKILADYKIEASVSVLGKLKADL